MLLLSAFVSLCEGFLGILPTIKIWGEFFYTKLGTPPTPRLWYVIFLFLYLLLPSSACPT